jgi:hypothetical protein
MSDSLVLIDAAGRRRSPVTMPGFLAGRAPRNKGMQYPPDPPRPEEIVLVMRQAGDGCHGLRVRALIAVLWRGGLRISEALALRETDIDEHRGSLLIRHSKGDKRREAGMDPWGFEQLNTWLAHRVGLPVGPLFCVLDGPTRGRAWAATAARAELRQLAADVGVRRRFAPHQTASRARGRARARGRRGQHHPTPARSHRPRDHLHLSTGHRSQRDHRRRAISPPADHLSHRRAHALKRQPRPPSRRATHCPRPRRLRERTGRNRVDQAASRKRRSASRISSDGVLPSASARFSSCPRSSGSRRTDSTVAAADPSGGRPRSWCKAATLLRVARREQAP